jgi:protein-S-isoprenylcysteine O-methyltransferase Ste14
LVLGVAIVLEFSLPMQFLQPYRAQGWQFWLGLCLAVAALGIAGWGAWTFMLAGTNIPPDKPALKIVTHGPYRVTRNPMYVGFLLLLAAIGLIFALEWALLLWPVLALTLHYGVILREERYLTKKFGAPYETYLEATRRYF